MIILLLFNLIISLFLTPNVLGIGEFTVDLYEPQKTVTFINNETEITIHMEGIVNYSGYNPSGDTIELSSNSDVGESGVSPEEIVFYSTGSQEFDAHLTISNVHRQGKKGYLDIEGSLQTVGAIIIASDNAEIIIFNTISGDGNQNDNSSNKKHEDLVYNLISPLIITIAVVLVLVIAFINYKKNK